jgi:hypothetical protein
MCSIVYDNLLVPNCIDLQEIKELGSGTYDYGAIFYVKWRGSGVAIKT